MTSIEIICETILAVAIIAAGTIILITIVNMLRD